MSKTRPFAVSVFAAAYLLLSNSPAGAVPPTPVPDAKPDLSSMSFYVGTWTCHQKLRGSDRPNTTTYKTALDGRWISSHDVAPPFDKYRTKTIVNDGWLTYNTVAKQWVQLGVDSFGGYGISTSPGWNGSQIVWTDTASADGTLGKTTVTKVNEAETRFSSVSHTKSGKVNPEEHGVCKKSS